MATLLSDILKRLHHTTSEKFQSIEIDLKMFNLDESLMQCILDLRIVFNI